MRSSATTLAITRAPFGRMTIASALAVGAVSAGTENAVADDADHRDNGDERGEARYDHQPAHPRNDARRDGIGLSLRRDGARRTRLVPFALRFSGG